MKKLIYLIFLLIFNLNHYSQDIAEGKIIYIEDKKEIPDVFVYDFKMTNDVVKSKVNLGMNMFSFLQVGKKQVHFAGTSVAVNKDQSLLLKKGSNDPKI